MPATILATIELGRGYGHVAHVAPLARGLARRGHRMALATRDLLTAARVADRPFARLLQAPIHHLTRPPAPTLTYGQAIADGGFDDPDHATVLVAAWLQLFDGLRPDALATEFAPASLLAAHVAGLRAIRTGSAWAVPPATRPGVSLMPWLADDPAARSAADAAADDVVRTVCRRFGAAPLDGLAALLATAPRFLASWPEFDHYGPSAQTYYGPMTGLQSALRPDWPAVPGPRTFVYLPGNHVAAPAVAGALASLGWPALWHGRGAPPPLPASVTFVPAPVDLPHVLGEAALLLGRGGHATGCEGMRRGCPQVIIPDSLETALLGWRLQAQRLASVLPANPDAAAVAAALTALAGDADVAAAVAAAAARYTDYDPVAAEDQLAADVLAALALA